MKEISIIFYFIGVGIVGISIGHIYQPVYGFVFIGGGFILFAAAIAFAIFVKSPNDRNIL